MGGVQWEEEEFDAVEEEDLFFLFYAFVFFLFYLSDFVTYLFSVFISVHVWFSPLFIFFVSCVKLWWITRLLVFYPFSFLFCVFSVSVSVFLFFFSSCFPPIPQLHVLSLLYMKLFRFSFLIFLKSYFGVLLFRSPSVIFLYITLEKTSHSVKGSKERIQGGN